MKNLSLFHDGKTDETENIWNVMLTACTRAQAELKTPGFTFQLRETSPPRSFTFLIIVSLRRF